MKRGTIINLDPVTTKSNRYQHDFMPKWDLNQTIKAIVLGGSGKGKTNMLLNLLMKDEHTHDCEEDCTKEECSPWLSYDTLIVCAKAIDEYKYRLLRDFCEAKAKYIEDQNEKIDIHNRYNKQKKRPLEPFRWLFVKSISELPSLDQFDNELPDDRSIKSDINDDLLLHLHHNEDESERRRTVFIIDDQINEPEYLQRVIGDIYIRGRKNNISIFYQSQFFRDLIGPIRTNSNVFFLFGGLNPYNLENFYRSINIPYPYKTFRKLYKDATKNNNDFLVIDLTSNNIIRRNLNEYLDHEALSDSD